MGRPWMRFAEKFLRPARTRQLQVQVKPEAFVIVAASFLLIPLQWICAWILALLIHEAGHCASVILLGGRVNGISVEANGIRLHTSTLSCVKASISSAAGPLAGIALLLLARQFPRLALCGVFQSAYNLLPIYPLDGGRILRNCLGGVSERSQNLIEDVIAGMVVITIVVIAAIYSLGLLPVVMAAILMYQYLKSKNYLQWLTGQSTIGLPK